jgi:predicted DNA-binding protein
MMERMPRPLSLEKKTQATYVQLPTELHEQVRQRSEQDDRTMAQTIRVALRYYLTQVEPVPR